jgi:hypothetical protein
MEQMPVDSHARVNILRRIAQLDLELQQVRTDLRNLSTGDAATAGVVVRGARLAQEKSSLELRLEVLRLDPTQLSPHELTSMQESPNGRVDDRRS